MTRTDAPSIEGFLSDPPAIPGLLFRRPVSPADYRPMLDVYTAAAAADGLDEALTEADIASFVENPIDSDPALDYVVAEVEGLVVAYAWVSHRLELAGSRAERPGGDYASCPGGDYASRPEEDRAERLGGDYASCPGGDYASCPEEDRVERPGGAEIHFHRGYVHPDWRRRGLGTAMLRQAWRRAAERRVAAHPDTPRQLQIFAHEAELGSQALARRFGYAPVRYAYKMKRDLALPIPDLPLPAGLEIRAARPEHRRAIWEASREAFQDHWGYTPWPEAVFQRFLEFPHYDPSLWRVAWDGDLIAGMVLSYINEDENARFSRLRGYTEDISVRRPWRRRGLASALIARSLEALKARGMAEAALGVDTENRTGALRLYESLGYTPVNTMTIFRRPLPDPAG